MSLRATLKESGGNARDVTNHLTRANHGIVLLNLGRNGVALDGNSHTLILTASNWGGSAESRIPIVDDRNLITEERMYASNELIEFQTENMGVGPWTNTHLVAEAALYFDSSGLHVRIAVAAEEREQDKSMGDSFTRGGSLSKLLVGVTALEKIVGIISPSIHAAKVEKFEGEVPTKHEFMQGDEDGPIVYWNITPSQGDGTGQPNAPKVIGVVRVVRYLVQVKGPVCFQGKPVISPRKGAGCK